MWQKRLSFNNNGDDTNDDVILREMGKMIINNVNNENKFKRKCFLKSQISVILEFQREFYLVDTVNNQDFFHFHCTLFLIKR